MKKLTLSEANQFLAQLARDPKGAPAVVMKGRKPIAVILPAGEADYETVSLSFNQTFLDIMRRSQRSVETGRTYTSQEIRQEFGLPPYEEERTRANGRKSKTKGSKRALVRTSKVRK